MGKAVIGWAGRAGLFAAGLAAVIGFGTPAGWADDTKPEAGKPGDKPAKNGKPGAKKSDAAKPEAGDDALRDELLKLNRVAGEDDQRKKLLEFVKDKPRAKKGVAVAVTMMKEAKGKEKPFKFSAALLLAKAAHYVKDYDSAEYLYEHCAEAATKLESGEKMLQAYDGLIDLYWDAKRYQDVVDVCERFLELKGPKEVEDAQPFVLERLVQAKAKQGKTDEALRITEGLIQLDDGGWYFLRLKGWVLREAGKYDESIEAYEEVLEKLSTNKRLKGEQKDRMIDNTRYILSGVYVDNKDVDKAAKQLQTLIKRNPDNPTYKNDLGFIWADHDQNLDEAEKLIREALDLDRKRQEKLKDEGTIDEIQENAAYLDSMGWVLFKQKKYKEALPYLKKAAADEDEGNHLEIWDHLGDCYQALGQKKEATDAWQKGLEMDDVSRRDIDRRKKVIAKLKAAGVEPKVPEPKTPERKPTPKKEPAPKKKID